MNKVFADFITHTGVDGLKDSYEIPNALDSNEITMINQYFDHLQLKEATTRTETGEKATATAYRSSKTGWIPKQQEFLWVYKKLGEMVNIANQEYWNFALTGMAEPIQLTEYHANQAGHYDWHTDVGAGKLSQRKLSISLQISGPEEYEGGHLQFMTRRKPQTASKAAGVAILFPSYMLHRVTPVTQGIRRSIVVWVSGPPYR